MWSTSCVQSMTDIASYFNSLAGGASKFSWAYWSWNVRIPCWLLLLLLLAT